MTVSDSATPGGTIIQAELKMLSEASLIMKPQLGWGSPGPNPRNARPLMISRPIA